MRRCNMCGQPGRLYACGARCPDHTPAKLAGHPEPPTPDPARTLDGLRAVAGLPTQVTPGPNAGWAAVDARAVASGRRRANPEAQAAARTEVAAQKARNRR